MYASGIALLLLCVAAPGGEAQSEATADLVLGTWILDLDSSTYDPGPAPKSQTRTYEAHLDGIKSTIETVRADGRTLVAEYVADYDNIEYPITGASNVSTISLRRVNEYTSEATLRHARQHIGSAKRTISEDGQRMTLVYEGRDQERRKVRIVAVYDKLER